jgi:hypothetical protein
MHRESYDKALDMMTAQIREIITKMEEKGEQHPTGKILKDLRYALASMQEWRGFYAPRLRDRADFAVQASRTVDGKTEYYRGHKGSYGAERLADKLRSEGWKNVRVTEIAKPPESVYMNLKAVDVAKAIKAAMENAGSDETTATLAFNDELLEHVADLIRERGFRATMIHRGAPGEGGVVKGYMEDPLERFVTYTNNLAGGFSKAAVAAGASRELLGTRGEDGEMEGGIDPRTEKRTYETAKRYIEEQLRNLDRSDRIIGLAKSLATFKYLGFNPRSMLVNLTAMVTTVPAALHQYAAGGKVGFPKIMREIEKAGADIAMVMGRKGRLKGDELAFVQRAQREGYDDPQFTRDAMGKIQKVHGRIWSNAVKAAMWGFGKTEQFNRMSTMLAAYRLARMQGQSEEQAYESAVTASNKAHGLYGRATLPAWAQGGNPVAKFGRLMYVYGKFGHNYLQMMYELGFKKHDIPAFIYGLAAPVVLAGGAAWPLKDVTVGILNAILRMFGFKGDVEKFVYDTIRKQLGRQAEMGARHGVTGLAGIDISGSLSIGVGIPKSMWELTGAPGGVCEDVSKAWHYIETNQPERAFEKLLPTAGANLLRAQREAETGVVSEKGRRMFDESGRPLEPTGTETGLRAAGFRSSRQAMLQERKRESDEIKEQLRKSATRSTRTPAPGSRTRIGRALA